MIRVTIDLFPYGVESRKKTLGTLDIANISEVDETTGKRWYKAKLRLFDGDTERPYHSSIFAFDRSRNVTYLVQRALDVLSKSYRFPDFKEDIRG